MSPTNIIVEHEAELSHVFAEWLDVALADCVRQRGRASLALPGGSVAEAFLPAVAEKVRDWSHIHVFWGDERAVPPDERDSNYALAKRLLFAPAGVPEHNVHRMPAEHTPLREAAEEYAQTLTHHLGEPPRLDIALLGVGADGHVCSLFPGHPALNANGWVVEITDAPKPPRARLTLSIPCLRFARTVVVAAIGSAKAAVAHKLFDESSELPATRVLRNAERSVLFLDQHAAAQLPQAGVNAP